jgi:hypothetical protein
MPYHESVVSFNLQPGWFGILFPGPGYFSQSIIAPGYWNNPLLLEARERMTNLP